MRKFGLDLGSSSLGWVITEDGVVKYKGVITFDTGMSKGPSGGYVSPTRERREARSKRNLIRAKKYQKWELLKALVNGDYVPLTTIELETWSKYKKGCIRKFPENKLFLKWLACDFTYENGIKYKNPYELRVRGLDYKLSKHEFGRALYHLVQRRGYKNIGETDKETKKQIQKRGESGFQKALDDNRTIAEALTKAFLDKGERARNQYPYREEYRRELELICKGQAYDISKNEDGKYNDEFVQKLWKAIIWQRPLKTQKGNIGKCTLESTKPRCSVSHPVFEIFRAWSFINTIKYYDDNGEKVSLNPEQRKSLFEFLLKKDSNFKFEEIRKILNKKFGTEKKYNYPIDKDGKYDTSVSGMPICKGLIEVFGEQARKALDIIERQNITQQDKCGGFGYAAKIVNKYSIFDLWHILFAFGAKTANDKSKNFLETFAKTKLAINADNENEKAIIKFIKLKDKFVSGYADLSLNAMCRIIPFLKEGYLYNEAVVLAKMPELLGKNWETYKDKIIYAAKKANDIYEWNKITVGITNNLIDRYKEDKYFADKDYGYTLQTCDLSDVEKTCRGYFGEKSWEKRNDKNEILEAIKQKYQEFFHDEKRAYRELPTLTEIFGRKLKEQNINIVSCHSLNVG